jgi:hypothetical protein
MKLEDGGPKKVFMGAINISASPGDRLRGSRLKFPQTKLS